MENSDKIRQAMYWLDCLDANDFASARTQINCARMLLRDVAIACSIQEMTPAVWQTVASEQSKIGRVKKVRQLLDVRLIEAKAIVELRFEQNGRGALIETQ